MPLGFNGVDEFDVLNKSWIVILAEGAAGVVAGFLGGAAKFLQQDLRKAGGSGLESDFGEFGGIVTAHEIEEMVLVEAVLEDGFLFEPPFEITASGPVGDVALAKCPSRLWTLVPLGGRLSISATAMGVVVVMVVVVSVFRLSSSVLLGSFRFGAGWRWKSLE